MSRGIAWKRYKEDIKVIKRLKLLRYHRIEDSNGMPIFKPYWFDYIGTSTHFMYKTHTTKRCDSRYKSKYRTVQNQGYYSRRCTRLATKKKFKEILDEIGYNKFSTRQKLELDSEGQHDILL